MKNFQVTAKEDNKKYWISRSVAIHAILICEDYEEEKNYLLLEKRGPGCPDHVGKWADPTGYLDWDETLIDGLKREVYEELGLDLNKLKTKAIKYLNVDDDPKEPRQNVTMRYIVKLDYQEVKRLFDLGIINTDTKSRGGEEGEVDAIMLLPIEGPVSSGDFAFNHGDLINSLRLW